MESLIDTTHRSHADPGLGNLSMGARTGYRHGDTGRIQTPVKVIITLKHQWDRFTQNDSNISSCLWRLHLRADGSSCYFSFFFSRGLIPLTSRLRTNYISIEWPLEGGIDIHGPPSAPGPMCIPQCRAPAFCITPGLHYLLCSLWSRVFPSGPGLPASPHPHQRTDAKETSTAQNGTDWNLAFSYK